MHIQSACPAAARMLLQYLWQADRSSSNTDWYTQRNKTSSPFEQQQMFAMYSIIKIYLLLIVCKNYTNASRRYFFMQLVCIIQRLVLPSLLTCSKQ